MPVNIPPELLRRVTEMATAASAQRLNVSVQDLTDETHEALSTSVHRALQEQFTATFEDAARQSAAESVRGPELAGRLASKLAAGAKLVEMVSTDNQYLEILAKNASMQKAKYDAYIEAGFTEDQAFRLLEAEVLGKAGVRSGR